MNLCISAWAREGISMKDDLDAQLDAQLDLVLKLDDYRDVWIGSGEHREYVGSPDRDRPGSYSDRSPLHWGPDGDLLQPPGF